MAKKRTTITIEEDLLGRARALGVNVSAAVERTLTDLVRRAVLTAEADRQLVEFELAGGVYDEEHLDREVRRIQEWEARIAARETSADVPTRVVDVTAALEASLEAARGERTELSQRAKHAG